MFQLHKGSNVACSVPDMKVGTRYIKYQLKGNAYPLHTQNNTKKYLGKMSMSHPVSQRVIGIL